MAAPLSLRALYHFGMRVAVTQRSPQRLKAYGPESSHAVLSVLLEPGLEMISGSDVAA